MSEHRSWSEVAPGIFRLCVADVNCYLVRRPEGLTLVDAGLPGTRKVLRGLLAHLGAQESDIDAVLLTHGHFDHVGLAREIRGMGAQVLVHPRDARLARHPYRYRPATPRVPYLLSHPRGIPVITRMALNGALGISGVDALGRVHHQHPADAPGSPITLWTPGHTDGHCSYLFEDSGVLISGDALVTLDPYTGRTGAQIVARAATADSEEALRSLDIIEDTGAQLILPGHGAPHTEGVAAATAEARRRGPH